MRTAKIYLWGTLALALQNLLFFYPHYFQSHGIPWDFLNTYLTAPFFIVENLKSGTLPLWMPFQASGYPLPMNVQSSLFYPATWITALLGGTYDLGTAVFFHGLHVGLGALGAFYLGRQLKWDLGACLALGVAYQSFGGFFSNASHVDIVRTYTWIPWVLGGLTFTEPFPKISRAWLLPVTTFLLFVGGYAGSLMATLVLAPVYVGIQLLLRIRNSRDRKQELKIAGAFAGLFGLGIGMSLIHLLPPWFYRAELVRTIQTVVPSFWELQHWTGLLWAYRQPQWDCDLTMRSTFLTLPVIWGWFLLRKKDVQSIAPLLLFSIFVFLMISGSWLYQGITALFPSLGYSRYPISDMRGFLALAWAVAGVHGLSNWWNARVSGVRSALSVFLLVGVFLYVALTNDALGPQDKKVYTVAAGILVIVFGGLGALKDPIWRAATMVLLIGASGWTFHNSESFSWNFPQARPALQELTRVPSESWSEVHQQMKSGLSAIRRERHWVEPQDTRQNLGYLFFVPLLNDYAGGYQLIYPRTIVNDPELKDFFSQAWNARLSENKWRHDARLSEWISRPAGDAVRVTHFGLNEIRYQVRLQQESWMVENEAAFEGWTAQLSTRQNVVSERAFGAARAWKLPAGEYEMVARFSMPYLGLSAGLSAGFALLWIVLATFLSWRRSTSLS